MLTLFIILTMIACFFLTIAVLLQKSKKEGGDPLGSSSTSQLVGVTKTADILEQITWGLAATAFLFTILSTLQLKKNLNQYKNAESPNISAALEKDSLEIETKVKPEQPNNKVNKEEDHINK